MFLYPLRYMICDELFISNIWNDKILIPATSFLFVTNNIDGSNYKIYMLRIKIYLNLAVLS